LPYQGTTSVVPPLASDAVGFSRCHRIPQGLKALAIIGALPCGTPEGVP